MMKENSKRGILMNLVKDVLCGLTLLGLTSCATTVDLDIIDSDNAVKLEELLNKKGYLDDVVRCRYLAESAKENSVKMIKVLLEYDVDPDCYYRPWPAIYAAASHHHLESVKALIEGGADVNATVRSSHTTALAGSIISAEAGDNTLEIVKTLVAAGASTDVMANKNVSVATYARAKGLLSVASYLEDDAQYDQKAANLQARKNDLKSQVMALEEANDLKALRQLAEEEPDSAYYINDATLRIALTGPKDMKVGDIRKLLKKGKSEVLVISLIGRVETPYKKFDMNEIELLQKMGLSDKVIAAMIDVTTKLLHDEKMKEHQERLLSEQRKIFKASQRNQQRNQQRSGNSGTNKYTDRLMDRGVNKLLDSLF